jgi:hypothetical protein
MRLTAIDSIAIYNSLALGKMDAAMRASHHFFRSRILPYRGIRSLGRLALGPHPPDCREKRKQKQVFHRSPRKQIIWRKNHKLLFLPHFNTLLAPKNQEWTHTKKQTKNYAAIQRPIKQKAIPEDG